MEEKFMGVLRMTNEQLASKIKELFSLVPGNFVSGENAIYPRLEGMQIYEEPLLGFASADDGLFYNEFKREGVIHPDYLTPEQWLSGAKTVISFFLPFTEKVRESNRDMRDQPYEAGLPQRCSAQWLHGRIEGQAFVSRLTGAIVDVLRDEGYEAVGPSVSERWAMLAPFVSNWSERHAAYAAGLGTFGLSKGLITEKGMAGRFGSVITTAEFIPVVRPYSEPFEYCSMCGACMARCPAGAIDRSRGCALGKDQLVCGPYIESGTLPPHGPNKIVRYGCGKCQVRVPCESGIPGRR